MLLVLYVPVYKRELVFLTSNPRISELPNVPTFLLPRYLGKALFLKCEFSQHYENHILDRMERTERTKFYSLC